MTYNLTAELELHQPVKGSGEQFDSDIYAGDMQSIDDAIVADRARLTALEGAGALPTLSNVASLATLSGSTPERGSLFSVRSSGVTGLQHDILFQRGNGAWALTSPIVVFNTKANLDAFVTAASTMFLPGQRLWSQADSGREYMWNGTTIEPTRIVQATTEPANPVTGQLWVDTTPVA